jgi:hypothetical protein
MNVDYISCYGTLIRIKNCKIRYLKETFFFKGNALSKIELLASKEIGYFPSIILEQVFAF